MEYARKCKVCGNIYCYTDDDLKKSKMNSVNAGISAIGTIASLFGGGSMLQSAYLNSQRDRYDSKIVDYTKCPKCNSTQTYLISGEEADEENNPGIEKAIAGIKEYSDYDLEMSEKFNNFEDVIDHEVADDSYTEEEGNELKEIIRKRIVDGKMTREDANNLKPSDIFGIYLDNLLSK